MKKKLYSLVPLPTTPVPKTKKIQSLPARRSNRRVGRMLVRVDELKRLVVSIRGAEDNYEYNFDSSSDEEDEDDDDDDDDDDTNNKRKIMIEEGTNKTNLMLS